MKTLAQEIFEENPNLTEDQLIGIGFERMKIDQGIKAARYYFWYNEDYLSDFVSEYAYYQKETVTA